MHDALGVGELKASAGFYRYGDGLLKGKSVAAIFLAPSALVGRRLFGKNARSQRHGVAPRMTHFEGLPYTRANRDEEDSVEMDFRISRLETPNSLLRTGHVVGPLTKTNPSAR